MSNRLKQCQWCGEPVMGRVFESTNMHRECVVRNVMGSVACQMKQCKRHGGPGCGDDPGLSKREAAKQAMLLYIQTSEGIDRKEHPE